MEIEKIRKLDISQLMKLKLDTFKINFVSLNKEEQEIIKTYLQDSGKNRISQKSFYEAYGNSSSIQQRLMFVVSYMLNPNKTSLPGKLKNIRESVKLNTNEIINVGKKTR